jgi:chemotaxis protein methyltransferase CheR
MDAAVTNSPQERTDMLEERLLMEAIHERYQLDFRGYSLSSISRQLERARQRFACSSLSMLQHRVLHEPAVLPELLNVMTIQVSDFFRDPSYFKALRDLVIPHLVTYPSLKVWVAGCGEGEELYSLAILFREEGLLGRTIFYATDVNPTALRKAEQGMYDLERIPLFTENHRCSGARTSLSDYYTAAYGAAAFDRSLRANVVFADHSLASDQVFAEVHFVSCRNVLIYFGRELRDRALGIFSDALVRNGFLGLGSQETIRFSRHETKFREFEPTERIYRKNTAARVSADGGLNHAT